MQTRNHKQHSYHKLVCRNDQRRKSGTMNDTDGKKSSSRCLSSTSEAFESESVLKLAKGQRLEKMDNPP